MEALLHLGPRVVGVELDIVTHGVGGEKAVDAAGGDQLLRDDLVEQGVGFGVDLLCLRSVFRVLEDAGVNAFESPGVEEGRPVDEVAQGGQGKVIQRAYAGERRRGDVFRSPLDRRPAFARGLYAY